MINGLRVKQAREIRKLTQTELANRVGVVQSTIAKMEVSVRDWPQELIESIAFQTGFPVAFFQQGLGPEFPLGSLLFRCRASLAANERTSVYQQALLTFEIAERMAAKTKPIELHLPSITNENPVDAAQLARATLGLAPDVPISHLVNRLERNGVFVFSIPELSEKFDAFSLWSDTDPRKPIIILSNKKPWDRLRYNCAHELGHLVLHKSPRGNLSDLDNEANRFAAEFLLPQKAMRQEIITPVTLTSLAKLKPRWGVAIQALVRRAYELEIISERQYRYLFEQLSKLGWRKREPSNLDIPPEKPRLFRKLAELCYGSPTDPKRIANVINAPVSLVEGILGAHASKDDLSNSRRSTDQQGQQVESKEIAKVLKFNENRKKRAR